MAQHLGSPASPSPGDATSGNITTRGFIVNGTDSSRHGAGTRGLGITFPPSALSQLPHHQQRHFDDHHARRDSNSSANGGDSQLAPRIRFKLSSTTSVAEAAGDPRSDAQGPTATASHPERSHAHGPITSSRPLQPHPHSVSADTRLPPPHLRTATESTFGDRNLLSNPSPPSRQASSGGAASLHHARSDKQNQHGARQTEGIGRSAAGGVPLTRSLTYPITPSSAPGHAAHPHIHTYPAKSSLPPTPPSTVGPPVPHSTFDSFYHDQPTQQQLLAHRPDSVYQLPPISTNSQYSHAHQVGSEEATPSRPLSSGPIRTGGATRKNNSGASAPPLKQASVRHSHPSLPPLGSGSPFSAAMSREDSSWSEADDAALRNAKKCGPGRSWPEICKRIFPDGKHTHKQCMERWKYLNRPKTTKGPWTLDEDKQLAELVEEYGPEKWVYIAKLMDEKRTGKQCRERWHNHLDPAINKAPFTIQEDEFIVWFIETKGTKWAEMAKHLVGRPDNMIKNHYNTAMQREKRRYKAQLERMQSENEVHLGDMHYDRFAELPYPYESDHANGDLASNGEEEGDDADANDEREDAEEDRLREDNGRRNAKSRNSSSSADNDRFLPYPTPSRRSSLPKASVLQKASPKPRRKVSAVGNPSSKRHSASKADENFAASGPLSAPTVVRRNYAKLNLSLETANASAAAAAAAESGPQDSLQGQPFIPTSARDYQYGYEYSPATASAPPMLSSLHPGTVGQAGPYAGSPHSTLPFSAGHPFPHPVSQAQLYQSNNPYGASAPMQQYPGQMLPSPRQQWIYAHGPLYQNAYPTVPVRQAGGHVGQQDPSTGFPGANGTAGQNTHASLSAGASSPHQQQQQTEQYADAPTHATSGAQGTASPGIRPNSAAGNGYQASYANERQHMHSTQMSDQGISGRSPRQASSAPLSANGSLQSIGSNEGKASLSSFESSGSRVVVKGSSQMKRLLTPPGTPDLSQTHSPSTYSVPSVSPRGQHIAYFPGPRPLLTPGSVLQQNGYMSGRRSTEQPSRTCSPAESNSAATAAAVAMDSLSHGHGHEHTGVMRARLSQSSIQPVLSLSPAALEGSDGRGDSSSPIRIIHSQPPDDDGHTSAMFGGQMSGAFVGKGLLQPRASVDGRPVETLSPLDLDASMSPGSRIPSPSGHLTLTAQHALRHSPSPFQPMNGLLPHQQRQATIESASPLLMVTSDSAAFPMPPLSAPPVMTMHHPLPTAVVGTLGIHHPHMHTSPVPLSRSPFAADAEEMDPAHSENVAAAAAMDAAAFAESEMSPMQSFREVEVV